MADNPWCGKLRWFVAANQPFFVGRIVASECSKGRALAEMRRNFVAENQRQRATSWAFGACAWEPIRQQLITAEVYFLNRGQGWDRAWGQLVPDQFLAIRRQ